MKIANSRWIWLAALLGMVIPYANAACTNETLHGRYAFTITGQILTPLPASGAVSGVAMTIFDGAGGLTQVDHVVHNGNPPFEAWRPGTGSYSLNADCTGWMTITADPTNPADASPELKLYISVTQKGGLIYTVVSGAPHVPIFSANIVSTGIRTETDDD